MVSLKEKIPVIEAEIAAYTKPGFNDWGYLTRTDDGLLYAVVMISIQNGKRHTTMNLIVRFENDLVIIELDMNSKPLVDALVQAGVPRDQIILAYAGEPIPEGVPDAAQYIRH